MLLPTIIIIIIIIIIMIFTRLNNLICTKVVVSLSLSQFIFTEISLSV